MPGELKSPPLGTLKWGGLQLYRHSCRQGWSPPHFKHKSGWFTQGWPSCNLNHPVVTIAVWRMVVTRTGVTRDHRITIQLHWIHYTGYILRDVSIPCPLTMSVTNWHWTVCILCHTSTIILGADTETGWCLLMVITVDSLVVCTYHSIRWRVNNQERNFLNYIL